MKKVGKVILIAFVVLIVLGALSSSCSKSSKSSTSSATQAAGSSVAISSESASSKESDESRRAELKESFLGTWDMTSFKSKDGSFSESELKQARDNGMDSYIVFNENGTADLVLGNELSSLTWDIKDVDSGLMILDGVEMPFSYEKGELTMGNSSSYMSFKKGKARASLPTGNSEAAVSGEKSDEPTDPNGTSADGGEVSPDLKEMLDSYEAFMDEYVEFMRSYQESGDTMSMLSQYTEYMQKYSDLMQKIDAVDTSNMSAADYAYYIEVTSRVSQKLLEVSGY